MLIDSHAHLDDPQLAAERAAVLARAAAAGVSAVVTIGTDPASWLATVELLAQPAPLALYAAVGLHPNSAMAWDDAAAATLRALAREPRVVAIGEIGLDYYRDRAPRPVQHRVLEAQLALAADLGRPVVIHNREAHDDLLAIIAPWAARLPRPAGVMHCFAGDLPFARRCLDLGFLVSFAGPLTYRSAETLRAVAAALPLDALLIETDAPYLAPAPHRGRRNEPAYVRATAEALAVLRGLPLGTVAAATTRNAARLFDLPADLMAEREGA
ncbi:MAG: TatD family hydrolase [Chloroflexi bacterium]|nr:TatD family hydrolase [Chloroflexota bacterium]